MNLSQGVILVSFGSAVKPSQMTKERRAIFLEVFSQLGVMYGDGAEAQPKQEERYFLSIFVSNVFSQRSTRSSGSGMRKKWKVFLQMSSSANGCLSRCFLFFFFFHCQMTSSNASNLFSLFSLLSVFHQNLV